MRGESRRGFLARLLRRAVCLRGVGRAFGDFVFMLCQRAFGGLNNKRVEASEIQGGRSRELECVNGEGKRENTSVDAIPKKHRTLLVLLFIAPPVH